MENRRKQNKSSNCLHVFRLKYRKQIYFFIICIQLICQIIIFPVNLFQPSKNIHLFFSCTSLPLCIVSELQISHPVPLQTISSRIVGSISVFIWLWIPISQQNKMSFKCNEWQAGESASGATLCYPSTCHRGQDQAFFDDFAQKIKNSICLILQACDEQNLHKSTKFIAYSIFTRYISSHSCSSEEQLIVLILCCLRLAAKFNEAEPKSTIFDTQHFTLSLLPTRSMEQILQFELYLFKELNFKINIKSPYQLLEELVQQKSLSVNFYNSVCSFIDFSLTLVQLLPYRSEQILSGCLWALKSSRNVENKKILGMIQQICGRVKKANQSGYIILQSWENIMKECPNQTAQPQSN